MKIEKRKVARNAIKGVEVDLLHEIDRARVNRVAHTIGAEGVKNVKGNVGRAVEIEDMEGKLVGVRAGIALNDEDHQ